MSANWIAPLCMAITLAGCALEIDETATAGNAPLQFSNAPGSDNATPGTLLETPSDGEETDFLNALFGVPADQPPAAPAHRFGDPVPYGKIAVVCDAPRRPGTKTANGGGFTLYDSAPGSTGMRAHYITGFDDRCARQFSAALAMTGDIRIHEFHRYLQQTKAAYNATDVAYEDTKSRFCRVGRGKPCGSRIDAFARTTVFVTAYRTFGSQPEWVEILLHDGDVAAIDFKTR